MPGPDAALAGRIRDALRALDLRPHTATSLAYLLFDCAVIGALGAWGLHLYGTGAWALYPLYWLLQGSALWSLFLIGHDAGHGAFSPRRWVNAVAGHVCHGVLLVSFYGWARAHNTHHRFVGHMDKDESHQPMSESEARSVQQRFGRLTYRVAMCLYRCGLYVYAYFLFGIPGKNGGKPYSQYAYNTRIFSSRAEMPAIVLSAGVSLLALGLVVYMAWAFSLAAVAVLYLLPLLVCMAIYQAVTFLHHTHEDTRWFYPGGWNHLDGALETVDYDWGKPLGPVLDFLHHGIQRYHVVHHLNLSIPHYKLKAAHAAVLPLIRHRYRLQQHPVRSYLRVARAYAPVPDAAPGRTTVTLREAQRGRQGRIF